jgi:hypothetical protein
MGALGRVCLRVVSLLICILTVGGRSLLGKVRALSLPSTRPPPASTTPLQRAHVLPRNPVVWAALSTDDLTKPRVGDACGWTQAGSPTEFTPTEAPPSTDVTSPPTAFTPTEATDGKDDEDETGHALVGIAKQPSPATAAVPEPVFHSDDPVRHPPSRQTLTQSFLSSYAQGCS